ncbi:MULTISPECIES: NEAT domain-containing protein [unclassified Paenibacillus]|uniref:NEAT domain-containing protein n=1 Tax=unclassified Paenibacillus TaxID=185978 RepID=UPI002F3E954C
MKRINKRLALLFLYIVIAAAAAFPQGAFAARQFEDGEYSVPFEVLKSSGNETSATNEYMVTPAKIKVEKGELHAIVTLKNSTWWKEFKVASGSSYADVTKLSEDTEKETRVVTFKITDIEQPLPAKLHIVVTGIPGFEYDNKYDIRFKFDYSKLTEKKAAAEQTKPPVTDSKHNESKPTTDSKATTAPPVPGSKQPQAEATKAPAETAKPSAKPQETASPSPSAEVKNEAGAGQTDGQEPQKTPESTSAQGATGNESSEDTVVQEVADTEQRGSQTGTDNEAAAAGGTSAAESSTQQSEESKSAVGIYISVAVILIVLAAALVLMKYRNSKQRQ